MTNDGGIDGQWRSTYIEGADVAVGDCQDGSVWCCGRIMASGKGARIMGAGE